MEESCDRLGFKFKTVTKLIGQQMTARIASLDLTGSQAFVLGYLCRRQEDSVCSRDIERQFGFSHPTVSGLLQRLGTKGFLVCEPSPDDRRFNRIAVTDKALQLNQQVVQQIEAVEAQMVSGMTKEEITQLRSLLDRMIANLSPAPAEGGTHS